ncbi:MAG: cytochrome o ubiquinol oxidase subunit IV, partial [Rhabdochlamydiaceae bacterium]
MEAGEKSVTSSCVMGFVLSLVLTLATYFAVTLQLLSSMRLAITISTLAVAQAIVQLFLFLHIGQEKKPHWKLTVFLFMVLVLVIIVFGTLWI